MGKTKVILYGAFKAMGDFLSAAPVIKAELVSGSEVFLLIFPGLDTFIDLIEFGANRKNLHLVFLPVSGFSSFPAFFRAMSRISPDLIWISPHAPRPASSRKIPALLWFCKKLYWPHATLAGAASEHMSFLFDKRVPVDRALPFHERERTAYSLANLGNPEFQAAEITFKESIQGQRLLPPAYDLLIHPGAGAANRKWPFIKYVQLIDLIPEDYRIAILGLPDDIAGMREVLSCDRNIQFLSGTLKGSITAIASARVALTMDSGNMFFANVLGVPAVSIFGASDPANVIGSGGTVLPIYEQRFPCQPCGRKTCIHAETLCITSISPADVADKLLTLIRQTH